MKICMPCQNIITSFYVLKLKTRKAQEGFTLTGNSAHNQANCGDDETEEPQMLHALDIVKNFIDKHPVQSIFEEENERRLIIETQLFSSDTQKQNINAIESEVPFIKQEDVDEDEPGYELDALEESTEQEDDPETIYFVEAGEEETRETDVSTPSQLEDNAEIERFTLNNIEFINRTPEYILNAYKSGQKASRPKDPDNWIRNKQRIARSKGEEYVTKSGKKVPAKRMKSPCKESCRFKCRKKITKEERQKNFDKYWELANFIRQRKFIFEHHKTVPVQRRRFRNVENGKARQYSSQYFLDKVKSDGSIEQVQVCESMFLKTFDICRNIVAYLHKKVQTGKVQDLRGISPRKLSPGHVHAISQIKANPYFHIEHPMPLTKMFELYQQECLEKGIDPVRDHTYRKLFAQYNECEFLKPEKTICEICDSYYKANDEEKNLLQAEFNEHIQLQEKCMLRTKGRQRAAQRASRKKEDDSDDTIIEEHLTFENEEMDYEEDQNLT